MNTHIYKAFFFLLCFKSRERSFIHLFIPQMLKWPWLISLGKVKHEFHLDLPSGDLGPRTWAFSSVSPGTLVGNRIRNGVTGSQTKSIWDARITGCDLSLLCHIPNAMAVFR